MTLDNEPHLLNGAGEDRDELVLTGSAGYLQTCSLVLSAVGIRHSFAPGRPMLVVPARHAVAAQYHLDQYFHENRDWPPKPVQAKTVSPADNPPTLLMIGALALFFLVTGPWQDHVSWFRLGAVNSRLILEQNEWWRLVTALTLHADQVHLVGNCVIGGFLVHMLCKTMGSGLGWLSLITCGALGNLLNILLRKQAHYSVGFSTSIFAAIGLFSGLQMLAAGKINLKNLLVPLGAGIGLLAMLGSEGERTDLGAHFFGFGCGLAAGFLFNFINIRKIAINPKPQQYMFLLTLLLILGCWLAAFR